MSHRGRASGDDALFSARWIPSLRLATEDLSWMLSRGYALTSSLKHVGDRYRLTRRQRDAIMRAACSDAALSRRSEKCLGIPEIRGRPLGVDGFNLIILLECAFSGAYLFPGRDGCVRDLASVHGSYRFVEETAPAISWLGEAFEAWGLGPVRWLLDAPVSNSGRMKMFLAALARERSWPWSVEVVPSPDKALVSGAEVVVTTDSWVLDHCGVWFNAGKYLLPTIPSPRFALISLGAQEES